MCAVCAHTTSATCRAASRWPVAASSSTWTSNSQSAPKNRPTSASRCVPAAMWACAAARSPRWSATQPFTASPTTTHVWLPISSLISIATSISARASAHRPA